MNKKTRTSQTTSNTYTSNFNVDTPIWSESSSSEEEDIVISKSRRKSNVENTKEKVNRKNSEDEKLKDLGVTEIFTLKL